MRTLQRPARADQRRFEDRSRAVRRAGATRISLAVAAVGLIALIGWLLGWSSVTAASTVEVTGTTDARQVQAVRDRVAGALGTPLLRLDLDGLRRSVLEEVSLESATVERSWPDALVVTVTPRQPALVLNNPQGQLEVVDHTGVSYGVVTSAPKGIPVVTARGKDGTSREALRSALGVIAALPTELRPKVTSMSITSASLVSFKMGNTTVIWGGGDAGARKAAVLSALLHTRPVPATIDVSAPDTPVTRL